jgi:hypothetical protein
MALLRMEQGAPPADLRASSCLAVSPFDEPDQSEEEEPEICDEFYIVSNFSPITHCAFLSGGS